MYAQSGFDVLCAWTGAVCYCLQLYFDFSGYSDMAVGLGLLFGIRLPENFNYPYCAASLSAFWRRWHMSLSGWFRDYLYIPLGGNRRGTLRTMCNKLLVFLATGLWHGNGLTFVLWGRGTDFDLCGGGAAALRGALALLLFLLCLMTLAANSFQPFIYASF